MILLMPSNISSEDEQRVLDCWNNFETVTPTITVDKVNRDCSNIISQYFTSTTNSSDAIVPDDFS